MLYLSFYKNWRFVFYMALFFMAPGLRAQQTYFQQEVNYKINVTLNDQLHSLTASEEIQYINNAEQSLDVLYFHLWPNAYKNNQTALAKQLLQQKETRFYYAKPEERGYIDSLDFKVNGKAIRWEFDKDNIDICKLILNEPLKSLDTLIITTPFHVKIPDAKLSRLGHTDQAYFITQWYPKPAVYDQQGWHPMPYLDQGEFYSEFGSFDVSITLPQNYLLAATGDRIDAELEEDLLNQKVVETLSRMDKSDYRSSDMSFPPSSDIFKTVRFKQYRVHDFAWFADKRFNVLHDQIELPTTRRTIDTWVFFTNKNFALWKDAINYVNESTIFYSYLNGDYPYNHVTAIDGTIMAGGGMEYPNITVIGDMTDAFDLDITIAHEVGHNWFYGILGSNERNYPVMDEGINAFYEMRYMRGKYPTRKLTDFIHQDSTFKLFGLNRTPYWKEKEFTFTVSQRAHNDQALNLPAQDYTTFNYGSIIYSKTPVILDYLMDYMEEGNFDKAMKFYYEQYRFKHPTPQDFTKTITFFSGVDLGWFTKHLWTSTDNIDYKIKRVTQNDDGSFNLVLKNKTGVSVPVNVYGFKDGKPVGMVWYNAFEGKRRVEFPVADVDYFKIDGLDKMPDINRKNNYIKAHGLFKKAKPLQFNFITEFEDPKKVQVNYLPVIGANYYNGFMLGAALYNYHFYQNRFEYLVAPMYGFRSNTVGGAVQLDYNFYPKKAFRQITLGVKGKTFAYDQFSTDILNDVYQVNYKSMYLSYYKIAPYLDFEIKKKQATSNIYQFITYTNNNFFTDSIDNSSINTFAATGPRKKNVYSFVNQLTYSFANRRVIDPFRFNVNLQHTATMAKVYASFNYSITVSKKHSFDLRVFGGSFVAGSLAERSYYAFRASGYTGYQDYLFENNFIARNQHSGFGFSQFAEVDGAMKVWTPLGQSAEWLAGINLKSPNIFILPVRLFADVVACDGRALNTDKFLWDAGINIPLAKDVIDVYIPLFFNNDIKKTLELNNISFAQRIRFTLNIHKLVPKDIIKNNFFQ